MVILCPLVACWAYWVLYHRGDSFLTYPSVDKLIFFRDYLALAALPYVYYSILNSPNQHYILENLRDPTSFSFAAVSSLVCIVGFMFTYRLVLPGLKAGIASFTVGISFRIMRQQCAIFSIFSFVYVVVYSIANSAGVYGLFILTAPQIVEQRALLSQSGGFYVLAKIALKYWIPSLSYLYFYLILKDSRRLHWANMATFALAAISGFLASIMYFEKSGAFFYIFGFMGIWIYSGRKVLVHYMILVPVLALSLVAASYFVIYKDKATTFGYIVEIVEHRLMSQGVGSVMAFDYFYDRNFLGVSGISNLMASMSNADFKSTYGLLIDYYVPETENVSGAMSSFAAGDAYGLFGWFGVTISGLVIGLFFAFLTATSASRFLSAVFCGAFGVYYSHFFVASSFYGFLWPIGLIYAFAPFALMAVIAHLGFLLPRDYRRE